MSVVSIRAVFDRGEVRLLEKAPIDGRAEVLITFLESRNQVEQIPGPPTLRDLKGIWSGIDLSIEEIRASEYRTHEDML